VIDAAIAGGIPLEINGLGLSREKVYGEHGLRVPYPVDQFWILAKERGAQVICNADAHTPADVIANAQKARNYAQSLNIEPLSGLFT
jgi:histidinol-phosphatase (PHP family)